MSLLFESICVKDGEIQNLEFHQKRIRLSQKRLYGKYFPLEYSELIDISESFGHGTLKCRLFYDKDITCLRWENYIPKKIRTLQVVESRPFDYGLKYTDRKELIRLTQKAKDADDIIISIQGRITDSSYANIALFDGEDWVTPEEPLLEGTKRQSLIEKGVLKTRDIQTKELKDYKKISLINAMLDLEQVSIPTNKIIR